MTTTSAGWLTAAVLALTLTACAPTKVRPTGAASTDPLPRPDMVLVYDFAVSPEQVSLNRGLFARLGRDVSPATATEDEARVGREVAEGFAVELVKRIQRLGLPAERAAAGQAAPAGSLAITGQFLSIDEGNRTERVVLGLGTGRTSVQANVQLYELTAQGMTTIDKLQADAKSGYKPGMALMLGVGGLAGNLVTSAVISGVTTTGSELSWATVDADGKRLANEVAKNLGKFFVAQGWIASAD